MRGGGDWDAEKILWLLFDRTGTAPRELRRGAATLAHAAHLVIAIPQTLPQLLLLFLLQQLVRLPPTFLQEQAGRFGTLAELGGVQEAGLWSTLEASEALAASRKAGLGKAWGWERTTKTLRVPAITVSCAAGAIGWTGAAPQGVLLEKQGRGNQV